MRKYKVVEVKKVGMKQAFMKSVEFESILNEQSTEGWVFDKIISHSMKAMFMQSTVFQIVFYKNV